MAIPKSVRKDRIEENIDIFDFEPTQDEMTTIAAMDTGTSLFFDHRDPDQVSRLGTVQLDIGTGRPGSLHIPGSTATHTIYAPSAHFGTGFAVAALAPDPITARRLAARHRPLGAAGLLPAQTADFAPVDRLPRQQPPRAPAASAGSRSARVYPSTSAVANLGACLTVCCPIDDSVRPMTHRPLT